MRLARQRGVDCAFMFVRPDGDQLAQIGQFVETQRIRPVIDKVFPREQAKEALDHLAQGRSKGKVVVQMRG
jgi:NADPH:quinone reductase-like Zn-dependent oxidoreductase